MLARSFLTPEELNISDKQFDALVKVLGMLERGELPWHKEVKTKDPRFRMSSWPDRHCGSVGCIGFWAEKISKVNMTYGTVALNDLFYNYHAVYGDPKPEQAAEALQNYLTTGRADWADVLA